MLEEIVYRDGFSRSVRHGNTPVRILAISTRLILRAHIAEDIRQADTDESRWRCGNSPMQCNDECVSPLVGIEVEIPGQPAMFAQEVCPCSTLGSRCLLLDGDIACQQTEFVPDAHMFFLQVPGGRWQVVHADTGEYFGSPITRWLGASVVTCLEPQDGGAENPALAQGILNPTPTVPGSSPTTMAPARSASRHRMPTIAS